jgi:hypothetical protein
VPEDRLLPAALPLPLHHAGPLSDHEHAGRLLGDHNVARRGLGRACGRSPVSRRAFAVVRPKFGTRWPSRSAVQPVVPWTRARTRRGNELRVAHADSADSADSGHALVEAGEAAIGTAGLAAIIGAPRIVLLKLLILSLFS